MASKNPQTGYKSTAGNMMHATSTLTEKHEMTTRPSDKKSRERLWLHMLHCQLHIWYKQKHQSLLFMTLNEQKEIYKWKTV
jgi:hypothetical protein